jgi:predicted GNAT family N-acyltransferase
MLTIKVVENNEEFNKIIIVRAIVYMHEQNCPYDEEFDLNDFTATHIIGLIDNEPILCARIRYIDESAKLERLAIRPSFRGKKYGHKLLQFLIEFCKKKGFNKIFLHAQKRLVPFYRSYGFSLIGNGLRIPVQTDHGFRRKLTTDSTGN